MSKTKLIPLTKSKFAVVDAEDFEWLSEYKWQYTNGYAKTSVWLKGQNKSMRFYMHRMILKAQPKQKVDHKDRDRLNNQRFNLRFADASQNLMNTPLRSDNTSGYKGVSWCKVAKKWQASIAIYGENLYLGLYDTALEAATMYNVEARRRFGNFASLNDIKEVKDIQPYVKRPQRVEYKGVTYDGIKKKYRARVSINGKRKHLGRFSSAIEAAIAYNKAIMEYFGDIHKLNNIKET